MTINFWVSLDTATLVFGLGVIVLTVPFFIYQYRKFGATHWWRSVTLYTFLFYMLMVYFLVILPLPPRREVATWTTPTTQLKLFHFLDGFRNRGLLQGDLQAWKIFLKSNAFLQVFYNVLLMVPFGVYMRYYFKLSWWKTLLLSFLTSLFFELTQLSGLYGLYARPYRLFDVDDLFLNTLGGVLGFIVTPLIVFMFPSRDAMDTKSLDRAQTIGIMRRGIAMLVDVFIIGVMGMITVLLTMHHNRIYYYFENPLLLFKFVAKRPDVYGVLVLYGVLVFVLITRLTRGYTLGKWLVKIRLVSSEGYIHLSKLLIRYGTIGFMVTIVYGATYLVVNKGLYHLHSVNGTLLGLFIVSFIGLLIIMDVLIATFTHSPLIYERLSKITHNATE